MTNSWNDRRNGRGKTLLLPLLVLTLLIAACAQSAPEEAPATGSEHADHDAEPAWVAIDEGHREGIEMFPAATEGRGNEPLPYTMDGDVKVFELVMEVVEWEVEPGRVVEAWAYNGTVPGPMIRVTQGERVRFHVQNELPESSAIHWHGIHMENEADGVPFLTMDPITPGGSYTYEFTVRNAGTHGYHSHHNAAEQVSKGLIGLFIVDPADPADEPEYDQEVFMMIHDGRLGYTINGKGFPATEPIIAREGERVRIRFFNAGNMVHPFHLHGMSMEVITKDGYPTPQPYKVDNVPLMPGDRYDVIVEADNPGVWAFHCHVLPHAEGPHGMHGMVTAMIVEAAD